MDSELTKILIGEDELSLRTLLKKFFTKKGFEVETAADGELTLKKLSEQPYALALVDINMPGKTGLEILKSCEELKQRPYIIIMTAQDTMHNAITAMKNGAYDYLCKPFELEELEVIVERALEARRLSQEVKQFREQKNREEVSEKIVGNSKSIRELYKLIGKVADRDVPILITGESGTGKELVAHTIHQHSIRTAKPFVAVNCAAIPKDLIESELFGYRKGAFTGATEDRMGLFEAAHGGTLFLDEIGDLPFSLQGKLLRVLQEKEIQRLGATQAKAIDVRILAATNQDLKTLVKQKRFREDLFFRLNVIPIELSPLRDRKEDIPLLAEHFLSRLSQELKTSFWRLSSEALKLLTDYSWPGNVRELENVIKRAALLSNHQNLNPQDFAFFLGKGQELAKEDLSEMGLEEIIESKLQPFLEKVQNLEIGDLYNSILAMAERPLIKQVLKQTNYNQIKAAKILGINRNTLRKKIQELRISLR